jgi:hypothetical protein
MYEESAGRAPTVQASCPPGDPGEAQQIAGNATPSFAVKMIGSAGDGVPEIKARRVRC